MNSKDSKIFVLIVFTAIYALSVDCPKVISFAFDLGMPSKLPATWSALQSNCCTGGSVTCSSQRVTGIHWWGIGLNGTINGTAIPSSLTVLQLHNNAITGSIPNSLPSGLLSLYLYNNAITGFIPSSLPSGLREMWLHSNRMSGDLPLFPSTLQYLFLGYPDTPGNHFTGTLGLNQPTWLSINHNWITDVIIQDSSAIDPDGYYCDLSNNPLLGNPNIAGLTMCTQNGLYSAALLPNTKTTTDSSTKDPISSSKLITSLALSASTSLRVVTTGMTSSTTSLPQNDCDQLILFAQALVMQTSQPSIWTALNINCCLANGVTCTNQFVTQLQWNGMGLSGFINEADIPSSLTSMSLYNNAITGPIPNSLPNGLMNLYLHGNQMTGDLPLFPYTLQYLVLGYSGYPGNDFTGSLRLNQPIEFYINDNWITNVVIQDSSQINQCDLSNNPLLGNPNISNLIMCTKNGLYSAALLPVTRSTLTTLAKMTTKLTSVVTTTMPETITTLKTTDGAAEMTATTRTTNIGYSTVQQSSSSDSAELLPNTKTTTDSSIVAEESTKSTQTTFLFSKSSASYTFYTSTMQTTTDSSTKAAISSSKFVSSLAFSANTSLRVVTTGVTSSTTSLPHNDCNSLILFAQALGMQTSQPSIWTALNSNCCLANGVSCTNQFVTQLQWHGMGLSGTINGNFIPLGMTLLNLGNNLLTGTIPTNLPNSLKSLYLFQNKLTGSIPSSMPNGLLNLVVYGNQLSGNLPQFPASLQGIYLGISGYPGNQLMGNLTLNAPSTVFVMDNIITDVIIADTSNLFNCDLSNNPLLGNVRVGALTMCIKNGIWNSSLPRPVAFFGVSGSTLMAQLTRATSTLDSLSNQNSNTAENSTLTAAPIAIGAVIAVLIISILGVRRLRKYLTKRFGEFEKCILLLM